MTGENAKPTKLHSYQTIYYGLPIIIYGRARVRGLERSVLIEAPLVERISRYAKRN